MKFSIDRTELQNALNVVSKGAATHSTLPILAGVLIKTNQDNLILQTTDLDRSVQYKVPALVEEEGKAVVPAKLFSEIAKSLPDAAVHFEEDGGDATVLCDSSTFSIKTMPSADFPGFPTIDVQESIVLPFNEFSQMIKKVAHVVSRDESRAILTGVLISLNEKDLKMVATDSYRLGVIDNQSDYGEGSFEATISGKFLSEIASLPASSESVTLSISENQIMVEYRDIIYINRRIEGNFPDYHQLIPNQFSTRVKFNTKQLIDAVKRTSLISGVTTSIKFDVVNASHTVQLSTVAQDVGSAQETIGVEVEGEDVEIAFNSSFIIDGLNSINSENVYLEIQDSMKPGIFKADEQEKYLYLIMPVRLSQ